MFRTLAFSIALIAAPANAANLAEAMQGAPTNAYLSSKSLFEIERCIVMADMPDGATVYRTPDMPDESLIFYPKRIGSGVPVIKISRAGSSVNVVLWHPNGKSMSNNVQSCT